MSRDILLTAIKADPDQPRKYFDDAKLRELAQSMQANGLAVPILLRPVGDGYIIVHGERRFRAAALLAWSTIPAEIREMSEDDARMLALIENVQRDDLSPIEEARAYKAMLDLGMTQKQLGDQVGKSRSYIATKVRFLKLPDDVIDALDSGRITEGHAKQLLRLVDLPTVSPGALLTDPLPTVRGLKSLVDLVIMEASPSSNFGDLVDMIERAEKGDFLHLFNDRNDATAFLLDLQRRAGAVLNMLKDAFDDDGELGNVAALMLKTVSLRTTENTVRYDQELRDHRGVSWIETMFLFVDHVPDDLEREAYLKAHWDKWAAVDNDLPFSVFMYDQLIECVT